MQMGTTSGPLFSPLSSFAGPTSLQHLCPGSVGESAPWALELGSYRFLSFLWKAVPELSCQVTVFPPIHMWSFDLPQTTTSFPSDGVPNNYIGGSGVVTRSWDLHTALFQWLFQQVWGLHLHIRLSLFFVLLRLWVYGLCSRGSRARYPFLRTRTADADRLLLAFRDFSPRFCLQANIPQSSRKGLLGRMSAPLRPSQGTTSPPIPLGGALRRFCTACIAVKWLGALAFGLHSLPVCVWAAPAGFPEAIHAAGQTVPLLPEPLDRDCIIGASVSSGEPGSFDSIVAAAMQPVDIPPVNTKHCVLYQVGLPALYFLNYVDIPCTRTAFLDKAAEMCPAVQPHTFLCETKPQLASGGCHSCCCTNMDR